ncbi:hypothetical protein HY624_02160 [Candidatus Uhrbacteria bacterium]|nr:hypothetical protein [Candidatus Uhrbacteria bacterium]
MEEIDMSDGKFSLSFIRGLLRMTPREAAETPAPVALPYFLRPGMGGTTIAHPSAHEVIQAVLAGGDVRIRLNYPDKNIVGVWTVNPDHCEFDDHGKVIVFRNGKRLFSVPVEGMGSCEPGAYAHTLFELPADGSGTPLSKQGYRCFHSSKQIDEKTGEEYRRRIILVFPNTGLPRVPRDA